MSIFNDPPHNLQGPREEDIKIIGLLLIIGFLIFVSASLGCSSTCPPCVPTHEVVEVITPVYNCPEPPDVPALTLPPWPTLPEPATDEQFKQWYFEMLQTAKVRMFLLNDRVETLDLILGAYRETE